MPPWVSFVAVSPAPADAAAARQPQSSATEVISAVVLLRGAHLPGPHARMVIRTRGQLVVITLVMGVAEVDNPVLLGVFVLSCTLVVACHVYYTYGVLVAAVFWALILVVLASLRRTVSAIEAMDEYGKKYAEAYETHLRGRNGDLLGPAPMKSVDVVCQTDPSIATDLVAMRERALDLSDSFEARVMLVLTAAVAVAGSPPHELLGPSVKGLERSREKIRLDYKEDVSLLKDVLRCSIICGTMSDLCACFEALFKLAADGVIKILQIKNRLRGEAASGGYRDTNVTISFEGLVCEVQIHLRVFFELKDGAHPCYELCRSLGLVSTEITARRSAARRASHVKRAARQMDLGLRLTLGLLRFWAGVFATSCSALCLLFTFHYDFLLPDKPLDVFKIICALALAVPYTVVSLLGCTDLIFGVATTSRWEAAGYIVLCCCILLAFGVLSDLLSLCIGGVTLYLLHVAAAVAMKRCCGGGGGGSGRAAAFYQQYLGISGEWFVDKTAVMQLAAVVLQATAKLRALGAAVAMEGSTGPVFAWGGPTLKPLYWLFVCALVVNATVPFALLQCERRGLQRNAVAALDIALDLVYFSAFYFSMFFAEAYPTLLPVTPYAYLSAFWPLLHIVTVARSIEAAAVQHHVEDEDNVGVGAAAAAAAAATAEGGGRGGGAPPLRRLPWRVATACSALALLAIAAAFFSGDRDIYPFRGAWDGACRPCECDGDGVLVSCALPVELKAIKLYIHGKGITGIEPGAFEGLEYLHELSLGENNITMLREGTFDGLTQLAWGLDLSHNRISVIEPGAFDGLRLLSTLALRSNPLTVLTAGAFEEGGLDGLRNLFMDDCDRLREVEADALPFTLDHMWLPGATLNCSQIALRLPGGAACLDGAYCDVEMITRIGEGICQGGDYDTAECAWDGGDC